MPYSEVSWNDSYNEYDNQLMSKRLIESEDKYFVKYSIPVDEYIDNKGRTRNRILIKNYGSGSTGCRIRNAVTGIKYDIIAGSIDEYMLFKVQDSTGRNGRREPLMLYYDSPSQYENHHHTTLKPGIKEQWYSSGSKY